MSIASSFRAPPIPGALGAGAPQVAVQPTDAVGPAMAKFQADFAKWQAEQQQKNSTLGGLFGLGGAALGGWASSGFPSFWK